MEDIDETTAAFLHDLEEAEEVLDDMTTIKQENPRELIDDVEIMETAHVQIRVWESGPRKEDGRHGRIVIEDMGAPIEVAQWLRSPQCRKTSGARKRVYVWVDDVLVSNADALPIPEDDDPIREQVPTPARPDALVALHGYQDRLEKTASMAEAQTKAQLAVFEDQINKARAFRDAEVTACYAAIEAARLRLAAELQREDQEIAAVNARRAVISNERMSMAQDLNTFNRAMETVKERMSDTTPPPGEGLADRIGGVVKLANDPAIQQGLEGLLNMYFKAKAKT